MPRSKHPFSRANGYNFALAIDDVTGFEIPHSDLKKDYRGNMVDRHNSLSENIQNRQELPYDFGPEDVSVKNPRPPHLQHGLHINPYTHIFEDELNHHRYGFKMTIEATPPVVDYVRPIDHTRRIYAWLQPDFNLLSPDERGAMDLPQTNTLTWTFPAWTQQRVVYAIHDMDGPIINELYFDNKRFNQVSGFEPIGTVQGYKYYITLPFDSPSGRSMTITARRR